MSTFYNIIVENNSPSAQEFYFFQQPSVYVGGYTVYTNSIGHGGLPASGSGTSQLQFLLEEQYYAGVQKQMSPPIVGQAQVGIVSQQPIDLATQTGSTADGTSVVIGDDSLYLTAPVNTPGTQLGAFRITTPQFNPANTSINLGLSTTNGDGEILLSNFVMGEPSKNTDVQPIVKFYIQTGSYTPGTVVNFSSSSVGAAVCDATNGKLTFNVTYNADGTFTVS